MLTLCQERQTLVANYKVKLYRYQVDVHDDEMSGGNRSADCVQRVREGLPGEVALELELRIRMNR